MIYFRDWLEEDKKTWSWWLRLRWRWWQLTDWLRVPVVAWWWRVRGGGE